MSVNSSEVKPGILTEAWRIMEERYAGRKDKPYKSIAPLMSYTIAILQASKLMTKTPFTLNRKLDTLEFDSPNMSGVEKTARTMAVLGEFVVREAVPMCLVAGPISLLDLCTSIPVRYAMCIKQVNRERRLQG